MLTPAEAGEMAALVGRLIAVSNDHARALAGYRPDKPETEKLLDDASAAKHEAMDALFDSISEHTDWDGGVSYLSSPCFRGRSEIRRSGVSYAVCPLIREDDQV